MLNNIFKYVTEFFGTLLLMFISFTFSETTTTLAISTGITLFVCILIGANISGGAYNPVAALCFLLLGKIKGYEFIFYICAELLGGSVGLYLYKYVKTLNNK
jgi:glycerol uptake facilitator-like aquaporin